MSDALIALVGLTGVGKSSVAEKAREHTHANYKILNHGSIILETGRELGVVHDRDEITELPPDEYDSLQREVAEEIAERSKGQITILDTHATLHTPSGFRPGLPEPVVRPLSIDNIILVKADPGEIHERRANDDERNRDLLDISTLERQQVYAERMASVVASQTNSAIKEIPNPTGKLSYAAKQFSNTIEEHTR